MKLTKLTKRRGTESNPIKLPNRAERLKQLARAASAQPPRGGLASQLPSDTWNEPTDLKVAEHARAAGTLARAGLDVLKQLFPAPRPESAPPTAPAGPVASVALMGNNETRTIDGTTNVSVLGNNARITITGHCPELNLCGNHNDVVITGSVGTIVTSGNNNRVSWPASQDPRPIIINSGNRNTLQEQ